MTPYPFSLVPFDAPEHPPSVRVAGDLCRCAGLLAVRYAIRGDLTSILLPEPEGPARRAGRLWEGTCLELFLGAQGAAPYWEFNFAPDGRWNAYRFASYRSGMREEDALAGIPVAVRSGRDAFELSAEVPLRALLPDHAAAETGVCAVLRSADGAVTHWALAHPGPRPDFHRRDGFTMVVAAE